MQMMRGAGLVLLCLIGACCGGCASGFGAEVPPGLSLAGSWRLDPAASDDPQKVLDHMREEASRIMLRQYNQYNQAPPQTTGRGQGSSRGNTDEDYGFGGGGPPQGDPLRHSPMAHIIENAVGRGDFLTVRQGPEEFVLDYGTSRRSFTPGGRSVVSAEGGVADQTSGWDGHSYVIMVKEQYGSTVKEEYSLSSDGALIEKLHIGTAELPAVTLTRLYRPTHDSSPRVMPSND
jgi:hypothetical protein